jgi:hypothetical protein
MRVYRGHVWNMSLWGTDYEHVERVVRAKRNWVLLPWPFTRIAGAAPAESLTHPACRRGPHGRGRHAPGDVDANGLRW